MQKKCAYYVQYAFVLVLLSFSGFHLYLQYCYLDFSQIAPNWLDLYLSDELRVTFWPMN